MRKWPSAALSLIAAAVPAAAQEPAKFDWFEYRGDDSLPKPGPREYSNPILQGFYPDPSIVRVGRDYYLVNSTFSWFPGMPVFHSRDLVHWTQVGNAFDRSSQLNLGKLGMGQGLYAPDISWHDGTFYLVNTCVGCGDTFVMTAKRAQGPWSDPIFLPELAGAIDPSIFFDGDGSAWVVNNGPPPGKPRYEGHRALWLQQFEYKTMKMVGPRSVLVDGGVHPEQNPIWIEGPHIFRKDGLYYLIAAEGGTAEQHSEVVFRSDKVTGSYAPLATNPILTQRDLPADRPNPITSTGHAKFVETPAGEWWAVFLGVRPYDSSNNFNTGRETFMLPVQWSNGWPRITEPGAVVPWTLRAPKLPRQNGGRLTSGEFMVREDFNAGQLPLDWMMLRNPEGRWWRVRHGALELDPRSAVLGDHGNPSFVARRQQHLHAAVTTEVRFHPVNDDTEAGIAAYQNDEHWYLLAIGKERGKTVVRVRRRGAEADPPDGKVIAQARLPAGRSARLRISARGADYDFDWSMDGRSWNSLLSHADGTILSTKKAGGFVGAVFGLYAHGRAAR